MHRGLLIAALAVMLSSCASVNWGDEIAGCKFGFCVGTSKADVLAYLHRHRQRYQENRGKQCLGATFDVETDMLNMYENTIQGTTVLCLTFSGDRLTHIVWNTGPLDIGL